MQYIDTVTSDLILFMHWLFLLVFLLSIIFRFITWVINKIQPKDEIINKK